MNLHDEDRQRPTSHRASSSEIHFPRAHFKMTSRIKPLTPPNCRRHQTAPPAVSRSRMVMVAVWGNLHVVIAERHTRQEETLRPSAFAPLHGCLTYGGGFNNIRTVAGR